MTEGYINTGFRQPECQGLQLLLPLEEFYVIRQTQSLGELLCPFRGRRTFKVVDDKGQEILVATEQTTNCQILCYGRHHPWEFGFQDSSMNEIFKLSRQPNRFLPKVEIYMDGCLIGTVKQKFTWCYPTFHIFDNTSENELILMAPCFWGCSKVNVDMQLMTLNGENIGAITKEWTALAREFLNNGNHFTFSLPKDLNVKLKAALIGAAVLIDFVWWSHN